MPTIDAIVIARRDEADRFIAFAANARWRHEPIRLFNEITGYNGKNVNMREEETR